MTNVKSKYISDQNIAEQVNEIKDQIARSVATKLSRGNLNVQNGHWPTDREWTKKLNSHPEKLNYLLSTLRKKNNHTSLA
ncbi:MAG: hypothetical protein ACXWT4_17850 [Methylobacter sp.]